MSFIMCERCQRRTCVDCDITPYHSGQTCPNSPQAKRRGREDEDATVALVGRISKPCPNEECGARIQKIEGCDHMTCTLLPSPFSANTDVLLTLHRQEVPPRVLLVMLGAVRTDSKIWQFQACRRLQVQKPIRFKTVHFSLGRSLMRETWRLGAKNKLCRDIYLTEGRCESLQQVISGTSFLARDWAV